MKYIRTHLCYPHHSKTSQRHGNEFGMILEVFNNNGHLTPEAPAPRYDVLGISYFGNEHTKRQMNDTREQFRMAVGAVGVKKFNLDPMGF